MCQIWKQSEPTDALAHRPALTGPSMLTLTKMSHVEWAVLLTSWDKVNRHTHFEKSEALYNNQGLAHTFVTLFLVSSRCATHCRCSGGAHGNGA